MSSAHPGSRLAHGFIREANYDVSCISAVVVDVAPGRQVRSTQTSVSSTKTPAKVMPFQTGASGSSALAGVCPHPGAPWESTHWLEIPQTKSIMPDVSTGNL